MLAAQRILQIVRKIQDDGRMPAVLRHFECANEISDNFTVVWLPWMGY